MLKAIGAACASAVTFITGLTAVEIIKLAVFVGVIIFVGHVLIQRFNVMRKDRKAEYHTAKQEEDDCHYSPVDEVLGKSFATNPYDFESMDPLAKKVAKDFDQRGAFGEFNPQKAKGKGKKRHQPRRNPNPRPRRKEVDDVDIEESDEAQEAIREKVRNLFNGFYAKDEDEAFNAFADDRDDDYRPEPPKPKRQKRESTFTESAGSWLGDLSKAIEREISMFIPEEDRRPHDLFQGGFGSGGVFSTGYPAEDMSKLDNVARKLGLQVEPLSVDDRVTKQERRRPEASILF